jgi:hypothetical protein
MDDIDLYLLATQIHKKHKLNNEILSLIWSKITKVDKDFSIDAKLNIEIPSTKKFKKLNIPEEKYEKILNAGLTHEDGHAFLFPFMKYVNNVYAIAKKYSDYAKIPFDVNIFSNVENIISDVINEIIIINTRLPGYEDLPTLTYYYSFTPNINEFEKFENERLEIEKNPLQALWFKHRMTLIKPTQSDKYLSDILYDTLTNIYNNFDIKRWINEASFTSITPLISEIFQHADKFYSIMKTYASKELKHPENLKTNILQFLTNQYMTYINYAKAYLILTLTMYRFIIENNKEETLKILITDNIKKPEPLSPDELDNIFTYMTSHTLLEPPSSTHKY